MAAMDVGCTDKRAHLHTVHAQEHAELSKTYGEPLALYRVLQGRKHKKSPIFLNRTLAYASNSTGTAVVPLKSTQTLTLKQRMCSIEGIIQKLGEDASNVEKNTTNPIESNHTPETLYVQNTRTDEEAEEADKLFSKIPYKVIPQYKIHFVFYYGEMNCLRQVQVQEGFKCPFCDVKCSDRQSLGLHLPMNHTRFSYRYTIDSLKMEVHITSSDDDRIESRRVRAQKREFKQKTRDAKRKASENLTPRSISNPTRSFDRTRNETIPQKLSDSASQHQRQHQQQQLLLYKGEGGKEEQEEGDDDNQAAHQRVSGVGNKRAHLTHSRSHSPTATTTTPPTTTTTTTAPSTATMLINHSTSPNSIVNGNNDISKATKNNDDNGKNSTNTTTANTNNHGSNNNNNTNNNHGNNNHNNSDYDANSAATSTATTTTPLNTISNNNYQNGNNTTTTNTTNNNATNNSNNNNDNNSSNNNDSYNDNTEDVIPIDFATLQREMEDFMYVGNTATALNHHAKLLGGFEDNCGKTQSSSIFNHKEKQRQYFHSSTFVPITFDPFEVDIDSEDDVDDAWATAVSAKMLDDIHDLNGGERTMMKLWNFFLDYESGAFARDHIHADNNAYSLCFKFIKKHSKTIRNLHLRQNFMLHLTCMLDFGLLQSDELKGLILFFEAGNVKNTAHLET